MCTSLQEQYTFPSTLSGFNCSGPLDQDTHCVSPQTLQWDIRYDLVQVLYDLSTIPNRSYEVTPRRNALFEATCFEKQ